MNGRFGGGPPNGWLGRWLDGLPAATADLAARIDRHVRAAAASEGSSRGPGAERGAAG